MKRTDSPDLTTSIAGVTMRSPVGIGAVGFPMINHDRLTPDMHAEVLWKHAEAGAGFICLPITGHIPDELFRELEKKGVDLPPRVLERAMEVFASLTEHDLRNIDPDNLLRNVLEEYL